MIGFTRVYIANQLGSDSAPVPVAVHFDCWNGNGERNGYRQVTPGFFEGRFVFNKQWYNSIDKDNREYITCQLCGKVIG